MKITEISVKRPVTILTIIILLTGMAIVMIPKLAVEMFPSADMPVIMIFTNYPGASPEEVEESVTAVVEKQLTNISGIEDISSTSSEGRSEIKLEFSYSIDLDDATNDIRDSLERVTSFLPDDCESPEIMKFDSSSMPIMDLLISGNVSSDSLSRIAEDTIQPMLERIEGVASSEIMGGETKEVKIDLSINRMEAFNINISDISSALLSQDILISAGEFEKDDMEYSLRINERFISLNDIRRTVVTMVSPGNEGGSVNRSNVVRLEDIADVYLGVEDVTSKVYVNGKPSIKINIVNESDTNTVQVANAVKAAIPEINSSLPKGVSLCVLYDQTTMISTLLNQVYNSAIQGGILAMLILFLFLRSFKSTLIIGISIPVSISITLGAMYYFDITLNMISLAGLILGLGMIVDNSIVILENIYKYRERGAKLNTAAILGSKEMVTAIVASTLTTLCVFIPMIIWKNEMEMLGQMFQDLIFTIVISLVSSLFIALTLIPALSSRYLKLNSRKQKPLKNKLLKGLDVLLENFFTGLERGYSRSLNFALKNRFLIITFVSVLFIISVIRFSSLGIQFQPESEADDYITISLTMPIGTSLERTESVLLDMKQVVEEEIEGYESIIMTVGSGGFGSTSTYEGSIKITLPELEEQIETPIDIKNKLRPYFTQFPNAVYEFSSGRGFGGAGEPVDIAVVSSDLTLAGDVALEIRDLIKNLPQVVDPVSSLEGGAPEYRIVINKDRAAVMGLTVTDVANSINNMVDGTATVTYWTDGDEIDIKLQLRELDRDSLPDLSSLFISTSLGTRVPISNFATFNLSTGAEDIDRENEKRVVHVTADIVSGATSTDVMAYIEDFINESYVIPEGVTLSFEGEARDIANTGSVLILILIAAVILVFGVMASLFESFIDPLIIFFSIPLLLIGVVAVYTIVGQPLSLFSIVGMVVLVGIVVNNGIVMVDYTNLLRAKGLALMEACSQGAKSRLRPILMTSLTTILGMVPLGFFAADGTESIQAIGMTVVGGLLASTFLTLYITPVFYSLLNRERKVTIVKKNQEEVR